MAVQKKPMYVFENENEVGIDTVPIKRVVLVESTHNLYILKDVTGLGSNSTVQNAINNGNLILIWSSENDGPYSGLDAQTATYWGAQGGGQGYRLINVSVNQPQPSDGEVGDIWFQRDA